MSAARSINLIGGRGYTGSELLRLLAAHPVMDLGVAVSRSHAGAPINSECDGWPDDGRAFTRLEPAGVGAYPADAWVLAMPNGLANEWVQHIRREFPEAVILDHDQPPLAVRLDPHLDTARLGRRLEGVADQIGDHPLDQLVIHGDQREQGRGLDLEIGYVLI